MTRKIEMVGKVFGRLTVIAEAPRDKWGLRYLCRCICGTEKSVARGQLRGGTSSCGCLWHDSKRGTKPTHAMSKTRIYGAWHAMNSRCRNPKSAKWPRYGGRGIAICERWEKFENFYEDMGDMPEGHSLDRINNDGNYEPSNCRWATARQQAMNRSSSITVTLNGVEMSSTYASRVLGRGDSYLLRKVKNGTAEQIPGLKIITIGKQKCI